MAKMILVCWYISYFGMDFLSRMLGKVPHLSTLIIRVISLNPYKIEWKARVETKIKGDWKTRKGGRSIVLVLIRTSLSNFYF